jgi:hypothetical protein
MPSLLDDPEAYAFAAQLAEDRRRKLTDQQALNAILQGVGDLPYTLLGAPVEIGTGLLRAGGMAQGEQAGGIDYFKRKATELGIRPPESSDPTMRDMRMGAEIAMGGVDPTRVARAGGAVAGAVAREAKPIIGDALENYMAKSGLAPRAVPDGGTQGGLLDVAYRGSHSAPNAEVYGATLDDLTKIMPADVYAPEGKRLYGFGDRLVDSEWRIAALKTRGKPDAEIEVYRAVPKGVKDINSGDWVTTSKTYADQHGERTLDGDYEIIKRKVKARTLSSEGYPYEFGYNE